MTRREAAELIAAYISGRRRVDSGTLSRAYAVAGTGTDLSQRLATGFGTLRDDCAVFASRAAEFASLSDAQRRAEFPDLLAHVAGCAACRRSLDSVRFAWVLPNPLRAGWKRLTEGIALALSVVGGLFDRGLGPVAEQPQMIAATAHAAAPGEGEMEWRIADSESGCIIQLLAEADGGNVRVRGEILRAGVPVVARLEVRRAENDLLIFSGILPGVRGPGVVLAPGIWELAIMIEGGLAWQVPLTLTAGDPTSAV